MTKDTSGLDLSFLNEEEASTILEVLERDERLRRQDKDRVSKLHNAKRDIKWLQGATGEWFEEIQKKKFRNDPDVNSLLKQPLVYRLKGEKHDSYDLKMSRSKSQQGGASSSSSLLGLRSPIASLFNFRKLRKQALNKAATQQRNAFSAMGNPASPRMEEQSKQAEMFNVPLQNKHYGNTFVTKEDRTGVGNAVPSDTQLERELFLVLGDLERTLVQEQSDCGRAPSTPSYGSRRPFRSGYSSERGINNILGDRNVYNESSGACYPDGTRTLKPNEVFRSQSTYRPQRFYEMYSNRHRTAPKQGYFQRQTSNESPPMSPNNGNRSVSSSSDFGKFSLSSWNLPFLRHSSFGFLHRGNHKDSKRTPISEIVWNSPPPSSPEENSAQAFRAQSLMDLSNVKQDSHRKSTHQNCMYEFYRSQQNVYEADAQKESHFSTFPHQEETRQAPSDSSDNAHSLHVVSGTAQSTEREIPCPDIVPMQTDSAWDEGNKENCADTDPYDSDTTIHSSDTLSDDEMEVIETGIGEHLATEPTFSGTGVLPSQQTHPSLANELNVQNIYSHPVTDPTPQYEYSCSASKVTPKHKISIHAEEHSTQNQYSSPAAELHTRPEHPYPSADVPAQHEHAFTAVATFTPQHATSPPVAVVLPLEHGLSLSPKLPSKHGYTSRATATLSSQTSAAQLHPQPVYSTSAVYELQLKHGRQHSTVKNEQQRQYGSLHSAGAAKLQAEYGHSPLPDELTFQPGHSLPAEDNSQPQNPSSAECCLQHGYPPPTELPAKHGYPPPTELPTKQEYPPPAEFPAKHGYPSPTELPIKQGYPPPAELPTNQGYAPPAELPTKRGYPPPAELPTIRGYPPLTELPTKHGYPSLAELPTKQGYPPPAELPTKQECPPSAELHTKQGYPPSAELPTKQGYPPLTELPAKHGFAPPAELPTRQGYPPRAELPTKLKYPPPVELPTKRGYPTPEELPTKHGYPPPAELPTKQECPPSELPTKQRYPPPAELPTNQGYPPPAELPLKQGYLPSVELLSKPRYLHPAVLPTKVGYPLPAVLPLQNGYSSSPAPPSNYECPPPVEITSQDGNPLPSILPAKHGHPPVAEIPAQHRYTPPGELPIEHGHFPLAEFPSEYKHSSPDKLHSEHESLPPASGEIPFEQDTSPQDASCTGAVNIQCDLHTPPSENTSIDPLFVDSSLSETNNDSSKSVMVSAETIKTCTTDLKLQPQFSHREKTLHTRNVRKTGNPPSIISAQHENQQSSISSTYPIESMQSNSSALIEDKSPSKSDTPSTVGSNLTSSLQSPAFSRSAPATKTFQMRVFSIASSLGSEDQTKYSALYRYPKVLPEISHASKPELQGLHGAPQKIPDSKSVDKIYHETDKGNIFLSSSKSINNDISCEKTPFQRSRNKSNADLHGSLPDISSTHDSLDLAHSTILPKSTDWPTSDCESIASRTVGKKAGRYTSILLHASSLPNLELTQGFLQKNSEDSELKLSNLKLAISESQNNHNSLIKKQDTLAPSRHKMIDDPANNQHLAQSTKSQATETQVSTHWKILEKHEDLLTMDSERSTVSVENTPAIFPFKKNYSKSSEISYTNLKRKDTDIPELNPQASPFGSILADGLSAEQGKEVQIALKNDPSCHPSLAANATHQNGYIKISSPAIQGASFSPPRVGDSQADPTFISVTNANTNENLNNKNCTASSNITPSLLYSTIKAKAESTLVGRGLNGLHKSKFPEDRSVKSAISDHLISASGLSKTEDQSENTTHLSDLGKAIGQLHKNKTSVKINVLPIHQVPGYDLPSANSESKSTDTKTTQPALPINSFSILSDLPGQNNSFSPESQKLISPSISRGELRNYLKLAASNNDTSHCDKSGAPDTFASQCDLMLTTPVCDRSVKPLSANITVIRVKPDLPGGRLLRDHLHVYTTKQRVASLSSNQQNNSSTLSGDQPNTTQTPVSISEDRANFREKTDITVSHNLNTNVDPIGTHINGQIHPPDAPSEAQTPKDVSLHHGKAGFLPSSDGQKPGKTLKEYKTKSTRSFIATGDKIEYRELVSVYYSLPRRPTNPLSIASTDKNTLSPNSILNKMQEFHIDLANTACPVPRLLGERLSTDTLLSDVTTQENVDAANSSTRRALTRSTSWDESEQMTISPSRICSTKNVSPTIPWNVNDTFSPDEIAFNPPGSGRYSNVMGTSSDPVAAKSAAITGDDKYHFFKPTNIEEGEPFYLSRPLNTSSSQLPEQVKGFLHNFTGMHPLQSTDLESRQDIAQGKEDYNQNTVEENLFSGTDNKREPRNKHTNAKHCLSQSHVNAEEKAFTYRSQIQNKFKTDQAGSPLNRWEGGLDSVNSQDIFHPASEKSFSKIRSLSDSHANYRHTKCNPQQTTVDNSSTVLLQDQQKTKGGPISPGKQMGKELYDLHIYANPIEDSHALYPKDRVVGTPPEQIVSPTIENVNTFTSGDTTDNVCEQVKSSYEPYSSIDWQQIYKITNRRHSYQDARQKPVSSSVTLRRGQSDSYVQLNKQKTLSPTTSPLQSLIEDAYDNQISPDSNQAFLRKLDKRYAPLVGSHKPVSPTGVSRRGALNNTYTQKEYPCRIKRSGSDPTRKLTNTSPPFMYKSFPEEKARNKNIPKLSSTFETPEEFDFPSPSAHDRLRNRSRMPHRHDITLMPYAEDNRNVFTDTSFQKSVSPEQNYFLNDWDIPPWDEDRHVHRSKSLKNLNLQGKQTGFTDLGDKSGRRFSATTNVDKAYGRHPSSPTFAKAFRYNRKFWSHSELMSTDENDNWDTYGSTRHRPSRSYSTSPTVGFGIFGKEQQLAFLENIKRSLTEGRLWRPCYLKNPGFLRREADNPVESTVLPNSTFDANTITVQGMPPRQTLNIYRDDPVIYSSDSDTDTTTDDEYYLDEFDKESEL